VKSLASGFYPRFDQRNVVATDVTADDYMEHYAENWHEWIDGTVIKIAASWLPHNEMRGHFLTLFGAYLELNPIATQVGAAFVMKLDKVKSIREPDFQIILNANRHKLTQTYMDGPADICVEIVSPGTVVTDYGAKFFDYETSGVREYWLIDSERQHAFFYRLNDEGLYNLYQLGADGNYRTPLLPELVLNVPTLWQDELPNILETLEAVKAMLQK
jgi:Uma2 family endonuclease